MKGSRILGALGRSSSIWALAIGVGVIGGAAAQTAPTATPDGPTNAQPADATAPQGDATAP